MNVPTPNLVFLLLYIVFILPFQCLKLPREFLSVQFVSCRNIPSQLFSFWYLRNSSREVFNVKLQKLYGIFCCVAIYPCWWWVPLFITIVAVRCVVAVFECLIIFSTLMTAANSSTVFSYMSKVLAVVAPYYRFFVCFTNVVLSK